MHFQRQKYTLKNNDDNDNINSEPEAIYLEDDNNSNIYPKNKLKSEYGLNEKDKEKHSNKKNNENNKK